MINPGKMVVIKTAKFKLMGFRSPFVKLKGINGKSVVKVTFFVVFY
jgi:hypothetical protein